MPLLKETGKFRGRPVSSGIGFTKNEFPQFIVELRAEEIWNGEEWVEYEHSDQSLTAYLVLVDRNNNGTLNAKQVIAAFGWSGASFAELNDTDYSDVMVQFTVAEREYNGNTSIQITWVDHADADPSRSISKLDKKQASALDKKYGSVLRSMATGKPKGSSAVSKDSAKSTKPKGKSGPPKGKKKEEPAKPELTPEIIWDSLVDTFGEDNDEEKLTTIWEEVLGDGDVDTMTQDDLEAFNGELIARLQ